MVTPERAQQLGHDLSLLLDCPVGMLGDTPHILKCKHARYSIEKLDNMSKEEWEDLGKIHRETYETGMLPESDKVLTIAPRREGLEERIKMASKSTTFEVWSPFPPEYFTPENFHNACAEKWERMCKEPSFSSLSTIGQKIPIKGSCGHFRMDIPATQEYREDNFKKCKKLRITVQVVN